MKKLILFTALTLILFNVYGQNISINSTGASPLPSAMLDISSTSKGLLIPRMTTLQRVMIIAPAQGLLVYDTDTHTFWFNDGGWNQITTGGGSNGPAGGDLSGNYPTPNVVKIQNLDIASGVPFDKTVLKWDALSNNWKGRNDSLFLPYNVAFGSATKLFGIQNNNTSSGSSAICGKSGSVGSGITPSNTMGVWGDNSNGLGVVGTSNTGIGTYGFSFGNHGVYGYSTLAGFAGVKGSHANAGGIGVMGEVQTTGIGVNGRSIGTAGHAGVFENTNPTNGDTAMIVRNAGYGSAGYFNISNSANGNAVVEVSSNGQGDGIYSELTNTGNYPHANFRAYNQSLGGYAFYGQTDLGTACYLYNTGNTNNSYVLDAKTVGLSSVGNFTIANAANNNYILKGTTNGTGGGLNLTLTNAAGSGTGINLVHSGTGNGLVVSTHSGKAGIFSVTDAATTNETLNVSTNGDVKNAIFKSNNVNNLSSNMYVEQNGNGKGIEVNITKAASNSPGLIVTSAGNRGIESNTSGLFAITASATANGCNTIYANTGQTANNAIAIKGVTGANVNSCIGVYGESGASDPTGIGVKGISSSTGFDKGSVTGINNSTGIGVFGEAAGTDGIGIYGLAGTNSANSKAAIFKNVNANNIRTVVEVSGNGTGSNMFVNNTNSANSSSLVQLRNNGTGNFLKLEDGGATAVTTIAKNGNIVTDGTMVVKGNKGIVRSSTSSQLRVEIVNAVYDPPSAVVLHPGENVYFPVTFNTAFSSAPVVYVGNITQDFNSTYMLVSIIEVTTTGCTVMLRNAYNQDLGINDSTWKLVAMGAE